MLAVNNTVFALQVHALAEVFSSAHVTALAWVHLLLLDLAQARSALAEESCNA